MTITVNTRDCSTDVGINTTGIHATFDTFEQAFIVLGRVICCTSSYELLDSRKRGRSFVRGACASPVLGV